MKTAIVSALALALVALAQQSSAPKKESPKKEEKPVPLFGGQLGIRSSEKTKESATLGFNGIDPSGKVDKTMLAMTPGPEHQEKVQKMDEQRPSPEELRAFAKEGNLGQ